MKQETSSPKRLCVSKASAIALAVFVCIIFGIALFITYRVASPPMEYSIAHPLSADYERLFYNIKCMNTDDQYDDRDILEMLYYLGIPKDRARELFVEAKENLEGHIESGSPLRRCAQETLDYYNTALQVLDDVDNVSHRKIKEASERFRMENSENKQE